MAEFGDFSRLLSNAQIQVLQHDDFRLLPRIRLELRSSGLYYAASSKYRRFGEQLIESLSLNVGQELTLLAA